LPFTAALALIASGEQKVFGLLILELAKKMLQGKVSCARSSGPIGIAQDAGEAAQQKGWTPLMELDRGNQPEPWRL
jgi:hypothetical protein